eukprot:179922_1
METDGCKYTFIFTVCILVFIWPSYIYFISICYAHRHHFVIRNRWPIISLIILIASVMIQLSCLIDATFCITNLLHFSVGLSNAISGLIYYRTYLLYAQTMKTRRYLDGAEYVLLTEQHKFCHCTHRYWGKLLLFTVIITSFVLMLGRYVLPDSYHSPITYTTFTLSVLIGLICLINVARHKVSDSIGVTKECIISISFQFAMICLVRFVKTWVPSYLEVNVWLGFLLSVVYGFSILFIPYNLVRKEPIITHESSGLNAPAGAITSSIQQHSSPIKLDTRSLTMWLQRPLSVFLYNKMTNLRLFAGYLCECFALENLLFLERAIVLYHVIKKYQTRRTKDTTPTDDTREEIDGYDEFNLLCYELKFDFLSQIYGDIEDMVENGSRNNAKDLRYKRGIVKAMQVIYEQFCSREAATEINIGFDMKEKLHALFEEKTEDQILTQLNGYEDMLMVFHHAISECWTMCQTIYHFQFKSYLQRHIAEVEEGGDMIPKIPSSSTRDSKQRSDLARELQSPEIEIYEQRKTC